MVLHTQQVWGTTIAPQVGRSIPPRASWEQRSAREHHARVSAATGACDAQWRLKPVYGLGQLAQSALRARTVATRISASVEQTLHRSDHRPKAVLTRSRQPRSPQASRGLRCTPEQLSTGQADQAAPSSRQPWQSLCCRNSSLRVRRRNVSAAATAVCECDAATSLLPKQQLWECDAAAARRLNRSTTGASARSLQELVWTTSPWRTCCPHAGQTPALWEKIRQAWTRREPVHSESIRRRPRWLVHLGKTLSHLKHCRCTPLPLINGELIRCTSPLGRCCLHDAANWLDNTILIAPGHHAALAATL